MHLPAHTHVPREEPEAQQRSRLHGYHDPAAAPPMANSLGAPLLYVSALSCRTDKPPGVPPVLPLSCRLMESRFPISRSEGHAAVTFAWHDAFRPQKHAEQTSIHFEKAAVLFNLGAVQARAVLGWAGVRHGRGRPHQRGWRRPGRSHRRVLCSA